MGTRSRWLTALVITLSLTAACSGDDSDEGHSGVITDPVESTSSTSASSTSTSSTTTIDPNDDLKAEVEAAYLAQWDAYLEVLGAPDPTNPLIE